LNYRKTTVYSETAANTAKTETIDLDLVDIVSRLQVRFNIVNGSETPTDHPAKVASKVEIVDGSDVLMSMSGQQIEAMDFYDTWKSRSYELEYSLAYPMQLILNLNFGRWLNDPDFAFDCSRFRNPQLKITHNKALGGSVPSSMNLQVLADVFDEKRVSPRAFLSSKEFNSYTPVASSYKTVDMPTDYILRKMLVKSLYYPNSYTDNIDEIRLDENNLKKIPLDLNMFHYLGSIESTYPMYEEMLCMTVASPAVPVYCTPGEYASIAPNQYGYSTAYVSSETAGGKFSMYGASVSRTRALVKGWLPHCCLPIEFGDQNDPSDWYDIRAIKDLNLRLHHASGIGGTVEIITQQLRPY
jgi:hypothetical protein